MPDSPVPNGEYRAARVAGGLVFTAGMTPRAGGRMAGTGTLGRAGRGGRGAAGGTGGPAGGRRGRRAADAAGLRLASAVSMTVYLAATADFTEHSRVADGASAAVLELLGGPPRPAPPSA
ncbi:hypothetical protein NKH77_49695 [Streptomyces sp. M19]